MKENRKKNKSRGEILPHSWHNIAQRLEGIYEEVCNRMNKEEVKHERHYI